MCGRFSVVSTSLDTMVHEETGVRFTTETNIDLRPTLTVSTLAMIDNRLVQQDTIWGIQPDWATHLIINAKGETAGEKKTFRLAMRTHRCLVPCSGWYEWRDEGAPRKQKYLFTHAQGKPLYMAGIWFPYATPHLVTLTTSANNECQPYHPRMPVFIPLNSIRLWLNGDTNKLTTLLLPDNTLPLKIQAC
ncbi:SOS response-associated peptidase [uncultured Photobacterium sp.]|uniref:SOS response-associated peptidase n=1 Tax=uncultured Photobacterium sp. TaxID=173973 RepID=UPI002611BF6E|nr:SOS response-associated peptidase family protein [uncultured Photobacterium sp.]